MLKIDDRVRVIRGPFQGYKGVVMRSATASQRLVISVAMLRRSILVELDRSELRLERPPKAQLPALLSAALAPVTNELINRLANHPEDLHTLEPYRFEEVIAELLRDMGHDVFLTRRSHDKGRDVLAIFHLPSHDTLTIVQCKRFSSHRVIGPEIVQNLLWVADNTDKSSHAMVATTSSFSSGARALAQEYHWRLSLRDFGGVQEWLSRYGQIRRDGSSGIWLPSPPSPTTPQDKGRPNPSLQRTRFARR